jgi:hypothetical protein
MFKKINNLFLFFLLTVALSFNAFSQNTFGLSIHKNRKYITIPFQLYNNLIVVKITYNNFLTLNFILDTGVRSAILTDSKMALLMNPKYVRPVKIGGLGGENEIDALIATGLSFTMAGLTGKDQLMIILTEDVFSLSKFIGTDVHGILGYEIFNRFVVEIDYKNKVLKLIEPTKYKRSGRGEMFPITIEDTKPYLNAEVRIKDKAFPVKLIVDTGAGHALALYEGTHPGIHLPDTVLRSMLGRGLNGTIEGYYGRIRNMTLGKFKLNNIVTSFPDSIEVGSNFMSNGRNGNLGGEILNRFKVTFNYQQSYIILEKTRRRDKDYYFNMSGIDLISTGDDLRTFEVDHVRKDSPGGRAGVQVGDILEVINGVDARDLNLSDINTLFQSKPGKKVRLSIRRGNEVFRINIILEKMI